MIWEGKPDKTSRRAVPVILHNKTAAQIDVILNTAKLQDCSNYPPGWRFKALRGRFRGVYQVRIDGRYRIRFGWDSQHGAVEIIAGEFHDEDD